MATWVIGDLQGCFDELQELLHAINYDSERDHLWFVGDLVNRGNQSLECLQFVMNCGERAKTVLGNHDLHLLAVANGIRKEKKSDTLRAILQCAEKEQLLYWLRQQSLLIHSTEYNYYVAHAGIYPGWSVREAKSLAKEVQDVLRGDDYLSLLRAMYGDTPTQWSAKLERMDRLRFTINSFTRMRFLDRDGGLNLDCKSTPGEQPQHLLPWYALPQRKTDCDLLLFGHWSTLLLGSKKDFSPYRVQPLDSGCVWGGSLTAMRLEDRRLCSVAAHMN